jgi:Rps23 Pro-64 3,4-dihydroxylase Tpa1-like proline 4-hydroxylase
MINPEISVASKSLNPVYSNAAEFPHIVFDNFIDKTILDDVSREALHIVNDEKQETREWRMGMADDHQDQMLKRGIRELDKMPMYMNLLCRYFNNEEFMRFLRDLTGISDLVPDWGLEGGGFHVTYPGGLLGIHHDFNYKDDMAPVRMYRKVNILVYLNEEWQKNWKGALELWKSDLTDDFKTLQPKYGRAIIFNIEDAPHGHPHPLECPNEETRRSLAFYYYSEIPPSNQLYDRAHWKHGKELL